MAYRIEGKDIVISGFESGISNSIYSGTADMRNVDIIGVPGEASVNFSEIPATQPPVVNAAAYTADSGTDRLTWAGTPVLYEGVAISLASNTASGLTNGIVYYVRNIVGATFQVSLSIGGPPVDITGNGTGTFTTYQYGNQRNKDPEAPVTYFVDHEVGLAGAHGVYIADGSGYVWFITNEALSPIPANALIFMGNIGGIAASNSTETGLAVWNGFLFLFGLSSIDYMNINDFPASGPASAWVYSWSFTGSYTPAAPNFFIPMLVSKEDGNLYFITTGGLGSILLEPNVSFDPTDPTTYALTSVAVQVPSDDNSTCLAELGSILLIGGEGSFVYTWNKIDPGFSGLLNIPDTYTWNIIATNQSAYVFAGIRGRIYITNGSGIDLYKKISDYLTGVIQPYIIWQDASFGRNQVYFSFEARTNSNTILTSVSGAWVIDLDSDSIRMQNKTTNTGYAGNVTMVVEMPSFSNPPYNSPQGTSLLIGWTSGTTYGVDVGSSNPYTNYESFIDTELIPVGTYLDPFSPSQIEWKTSAPLVTGEGVRISFRPSITDAWTVVGESLTAGLVAEMFQANFEKVQWVQFKAELKSTLTNPSYVRLVELRVRDFPSGKNNRP